MLLYLGLFIPIISISIILFYFEKKSNIIRNVIILFSITFLTIFVSKLLIEKLEVRSIEYWGSLVDRVEYYEEWNQWVVETCSTTTCDGNNNCTTTYYDCSHSVYYPPIYTIVSTNGEKVDIDKYEYLSIKNKFKNNSFVELNRDYYTIDGDMYFSKWMNDTASAVTVNTLHHYENRIKVADQSLFHFQKVTDEDIIKYDLKKYPSINSYYKMPVILGADNDNDAIIAEQKLQFANGKLGKKKEVKIYLLVFKNQPIEAAFYQEWYWSGGNKNEFIVCIGTDNNKNVNWSKVISWTTNERLKVDIKDYIESQKTLNLSNTADYITKEVDENFVRRHFKEFDYLSVEPSTKGILITFGIIIFFNLLISFFIIKHTWN